jgi:translation initiation factor IF-2
MSANSIQKAPVVAVVGHIDHGKSTLLDYLRKSNIVEGEAGGITQHLSAYEIEHSSTSSTGSPHGSSGGVRKITFLDTPGHAAFEKMRARGLEVADVAILVVSAEEGVKPQTIEAVKTIRAEGVPFIVAINKIDKPGANIEKTKSSLIENEVYLEGMGGDVAFVPISAKRGDGIPELLDLVLLAADISDLSYEPDQPGEGAIIEANIDTRKGITATLIIEKGSLKSGMSIVAGESTAPVRIMENYLGKPIKEAVAGSAVRIVGFSSLPQIGSRFTAVSNKKEAEALALENKKEASRPEAARTTIAPTEDAAPTPVLPIVIKADVAGTLDAIRHEIAKLPQERLELRVVGASVGGVTEADVKLVGSTQNPGLILGFNSKPDARAKELAERQGVEIAQFDIIYKLAEWLEAKAKERTPRMSVVEVTGAAKVIKLFSVSKNRVVLGGKVEEGALEDGAQFRLMRGEEEAGRGHIKSLQTGKAPAKRVEAGLEFGAMVDSPVTPQAGDRLECFVMAEK